MKTGLVVLLLVLASCVAAQDVVLGEEVTTTDSLATEVVEVPARSASWSLDGRKCKSLPKPKNGFKQEGKVVVAVIIDSNGKVVSAKATEGTTISNEATIDMALKAAFKAEFSPVKKPERQFGTITYIFSFR